MKKIKGGIDAVTGFYSSGISCGIKESGAQDLTLISSENGCIAAGVFTKNRVKAAPVSWCQKIARNGAAKAILINSGNANACTGIQGERDTEEMGKITAGLLDVAPNRVFVCSTGVIGVPMPMKKIIPGIPLAVNALSRQGNRDAAEGIMTTDTFPKSGALELVIGGKKVRIGGIAKGSGMIQPDMATMLAFIVTDVKISGTLLKAALRQAVETTFNRITVDGETSTNDTVLVMASSRAGNRTIVKTGGDYDLFCTALHALCSSFAEQIIRDGEGATKQIRIRVKGAKTGGDAKKVAKGIANSNLVKTAFFGEDPNWGRIVSAAGNAGASVRFDAMDLSMGRISIVAQGKPVAGGMEERAKKYLKNKKIDITLDLNLGDCEAEVLTTDLTYDYIRINAEYRT